MTIKQLSQYRHYQFEAEHLRKQLNTVSDTVSGSSPEYPYTKHTITIEGLEQKHQAQLRTAYLKAYTEQIKLEAFIQSVEDPLVRDIIRLKFEDCLTWPQVEAQIPGSTKDSLRMLLVRYLERRNNNVYCKSKLGRARRIL